jgi:hypothetical protein
MKTERVTLLTSPEFKAFLSTEAEREGVSVAELIRARCELRPSAEQAQLQSLAAELRLAVGQAKRALREGLDEAHGVLAELEAGRSRTAVPLLAPSKRAARKAARRAAR